MSAELAASTALAYERFGILLLLATLGAALGGFRGRRAAIAGAIGLPLVALVPLPGASLLGFLLGMIGALSAASLVLFGTLLTRALSLPSRHEGIDRHLLALAWPVFLIGLVFYPPVLGVGPYDPYRLGFYGLALPFLLVLLLAYAWFRRARLVAIWLAVTAVVALTQISPSANLWDSVIDPIAVIASAGLAIASVIRRIRRAPA